MLRRTFGSSAVPLIAAPGALISSSAMAKGRGKAAARSPAAARGRGRGTVGVGGPRPPPVPVAIPPGVDQQGRNANHYVKVAEWRDIIEGHSLFTNIAQEMPLSIADSGTQHPFNPEDYALAISRDAGYTAGINLFWCDTLYSPALGIPIRAETIPDLMDCYFPVPAAMPHTICISVLPDERPLDSRGALLAINPEEMRHAMMASIARDIIAGVGQAVLEQWRTLALSCTGNFVVHATEAARLHMAMQLRENLANDHETMSRTQLQRVYEIVHFRDVFARLNGRDQAGAATIAAAYANVRMAKGREKISKSFVDTALTIHTRLLAFPSAEKLLLDMHSALPRDANPFNSVHRLQAIISKCGNSKDNTLWVLHHIRHMIIDLKVDCVSADFSVDGLRGSHKTSNRGLVDVILLKKEAIGHLCHKLPIQLGIEGDSDWLGEIRASLKDHSSFLASRSGDGLTWRNRLTTSQARYVAFAEDLLYGSRHDVHLKALCRAGKTIASIETFPGLSDALDDVKSLLATEQTADQKADVDTQVVEGDTMPNIVLKIIQSSDATDKTKKDTPRDINLADLGEDDRAEWLRSREFLKRQISNYVHIIALDTVADLTEAVLTTPAGKFEGGCKVGGRTRFVGVVWDSRVMGEASARPSVRLPPLQIQEVHRLFESIRARHDRHELRLAHEKKALHPFDLYVSLSGGRDLGTQYQKWFQSMGPPTAVSRSVHVFLDPVSVQARFEKVRGIASNRTHDAIRLTAAPWPRVELKQVPRMHYRGTNASDSIGPVVLNQMDDAESWILTWAQKKQLYGVNGLIAVGGRGDVVDDGPDDEEPPDDAAAPAAPGAPNLRRTDDTREIVFYHSLPSLFWDEIVHDYQLGAILDLAVGDGALALTAVRNRLAYTGFAFTQSHKDMVMDRLLDLMSAGSLTAGDKWYDPNLVKTLIAASKRKDPNNEEEPAAGPAKKKAKQTKPKDTEPDPAKKRDGQAARPKETKG